MLATRKKRTGARNWSEAPLHDELGEALRAELARWPEVEMRPMMGTLSFFRGREMLGCYIHRALFKNSPPKWAPRPGAPPVAWIRLRAEQKKEALRRPLVREARSNAMKTWVEVELDSRTALAEAVLWFGRAYESPRSKSRKAIAGRRAVSKRGARRGRTLRQ